MCRLAPHDPRAARSGAAASTQDAGIRPSQEQTQGSWRESQKMQMASRGRVFGTAVVACIQFPNYGSRVGSSFIATEADWHQYRPASVLEALGRDPLAPSRQERKRHPYGLPKWDGLGIEGPLPLPLNGPIVAVAEAFPDRPGCRQKPWEARCACTCEPRGARVSAFNAF